MDLFVFIFSELLPLLAAVRYPKILLKRGTAVIADFLALGRVTKFAADLVPFRFGEFRIGLFIQLLVRWPSFRADGRHHKK